MKALFFGILFAVLPLGANASDRHHHGWHHDNGHHYGWHHDGGDYHHHHYYQPYQYDRYDDYYEERYPVYRTYPPTIYVQPYCALIGGLTFCW